MGKTARAFLATAFFLSGATGLVLEVAWSKELSFLLGNTTYAVSTVVAAYMGGLGLGAALASRWAARVHRPARAYALCELGVGVFAFASIPLFRATRPLFGALYGVLEPSGGLFLALRFLTLFLLMAPAVVLMGMSLPLVVGALSRGRKGHALDAGVAYGVNTVGAVVGTVAGGFLLMPALGILGTALTVGAADLILGGAVLVLDRNMGVSGTPPPPAGKRRPTKGAQEDLSTGTGWNGRQWLTGALFGLSGFLAMGYEIAWFRLLGLTTGPTVFAFSAMLAIYLAGLGLGSAALSGWAARTRLHGGKAMARLELALGVSTALGLYYYNHLPGLYGDLFSGLSSGLGPLGPAAAHLALSAVVLFLPCFLMGALFPVAVRALGDFGGERPAESDVGRLYALNTLGGILGSLASGFFLLPAMGLWRGMAAASVGSLALGGVFAVAVAQPRVRRAWGAGLAAAVGLACVAAAPAWDAEGFNRGAYRRVYAGLEGPPASSGRLLDIQEGVNTLVAVYNHGGECTLHVMGKPDASTSPWDMMTQTVIGHLPLFFTQKADRVAVVGYGSGTTVGAVLSHPEVGAVEVVEIEQAVVDMSPYFSCVNGDPPQDPRCTVIIEDARVYLDYGERVYDVVISEPSNPWLAGVANLFTVDYYRLVKRRLRPGGVFCSWIQTYETSEETFRTVLASIRSVFPHCALFQIHGDMVILSSDEPLVAPWGAVEAGFRVPKAGTQLARVGLRTPYAVTAYFRAKDSEIDAYLEGVPQLNTDDNVWLEHDSVRNLLNGPQLRAAWPAWERRLAALGGGRRLARLETTFPDLPLEGAVREQLRLIYGADPIFDRMDRPFDIWVTYRPALVEGMREELQGGGLGVPPGQFEAWVEEGESHRNALARAGELLVDLPLEVRAKGMRLEEALKVAPDSLAALALSGDYFIADLRDYNRAEPYYLAVSERPDNVNYYSAILNLGHIALLRTLNENRDLWKEAETRYWSAARFNPYRPRAWVDLGHFYTLRGDRAAAVSALREGLRSNPDDPSILAKLREVGDPGARESQSAGRR